MVFIECRIEWSVFVLIEMMDFCRNDEYNQYQNIPTGYLKMFTRIIYLVFDSNNIVMQQVNPLYSI